MKYLCLGYHDLDAWDAMAESDRDTMMKDLAAYETKLRKKHHVVDTTALQSPRTAATLRFVNGKVVVTDGPFAETKEQIGGLMLLEARDLNHAIQLMSELPCMRLGGSMEIRPVQEVDPVCQYRNSQTQTES